VLVDAALHTIEVAMFIDEKSLASIDQAKEAALRVLLHNAHGQFQGLPRTAGWGCTPCMIDSLEVQVLFTS
jgi:hypothetical protein